MTRHFAKLRDQIDRIADLKLVVLDPLSSFMHADINADPAAGSFVTGLLAGLATETGAAIIVAHHMRKPQGNRPITTVEQARDAVRGSSALVDGVRLVYGIWPMSEELQAGVFKTLDDKPARNALFQGAVVKANGSTDRTIRTYLRAPNGLLVDVTEQLYESRLGKAELSEALIASIAKAARNGHPYTHTGGNGVYRQRHRLAAVFHDVSRNRLQNIIQDLLNDNVLVKGKASGSKEDKWLDVPNGPFANGVGGFVLGADEGENK